MSHVDESERPSLGALFEQRHEIHPALSERHDPSADTWPPLCDFILGSAEFERWHQLKDEHWMMRCIGAPGSGKTTLSALVTEKLKERYNGKTEHVASIFLQADVVEGDGAFAECFFHSIFKQLCAKNIDADANEEYVTKYQLYLDVRKHRDQNSNLHIEHLLDALYLRLSKLARAFLIVDDFDRCSIEADSFLEQELSFMASQGLKVFLTSRVPCFKRFPRDPKCDSESCPKTEIPLVIYWKCKGCEARGIGPENADVLCRLCRKKGQTCRKCGDSANFLQAFDHIERSLNYNTQVDRFVDWDLEREHGNLGFKSANEEDLPPHSELGSLLTETGKQETLENFRGKIQHRAQANVSLARLRLDYIHRAQAADVVHEPVADVLPSNIVALFNAGMRSIESQPLAQRELGFKLIAAVTYYDFKQHGLWYDVVDRILSNTATTFGEHQPNRVRPASVSSAKTVVKRHRATHPPEAPEYHQRLKEMLRAARGFIVVDMSTRRYAMKAYCETFHTYAKENYCESLIRARATLDFTDTVLDDYGLRVLV